MRENINMVTIEWYKLLIGKIIKIIKKYYPISCKRENHTYIIDMI